jgi:drug/metabolite transporter (DMT)-like permease
VLRLRRTIERASRHRWLGVLVIILLIALAVLIGFHDLDHALDPGNVLLCVGLAVLGAVVFTLDRRLHRFGGQTAGRTPPGRVRAPDGAPPALAFSVPLRR